MVFRMDRRHTVLLQAGIAIVAIILFIGVLNSVVYSHRVPLVTTESLWQHAKSVGVYLALRDPGAAQTRHTVYNLSAVGIFHDGYLYISVPYIGNEHLRAFTLQNLYTVDGRPLTLNRLVESGANYVRLYVEPVNTSAVTFSPTYAVEVPRLFVDSDGNGMVQFWLDRLLVSLAPELRNTAADAPAAAKWSTMFPDRGRFNRTVQLDVGALVINGMGFGERIVGLTLVTGDASQALRGLKLKLEIYGVSEKPVLRALTEPIYSLFAALYATLLAVIKRVRQFAASAFGGFASSFTLTGLIGDPVTALILTMVFVTVVFLVIKKKR